MSEFPLPIFPSKSIADPQPNHAVLMVRFANDCMMKMNELTHELVGTLGEETGTRRVLLKDRWELLKVWLCYTYEN